CHTNHSDQHSFPTRRSSDLLTNQRVRLDWLLTPSRRTTFSGNSPKVCRNPGGAPTRDTVYPDLIPSSWWRGAASPCCIVFGIKRSEEHTSELQSRGHLVCRL